jgi:hypothetical protein
VLLILQGKGNPEAIVESQLMPRKDARPGLGCHFRALESDREVLQPERSSRNQIKKLARVSGAWEVSHETSTLLQLAPQFLPRSETYTSSRESSQHKRRQRIDNRSCVGTSANGTFIPSHFAIIAWLP